jgi:hypothetical protein
MAFYSLRNDYARLYHAAGTSTPLLSVERAPLAPGCGSNFDVLDISELPRWVDSVISPTGSELALSAGSGNSRSLPDLLKVAI